jgi:hypothetical protein
MNLWQTNLNDGSSESDEDTQLTSFEHITTFSSPFSTRETEKAFRREANSPFVQPKRDAEKID